MRFTPEAEVSIRRITGLAIAPEGDLVAYCVEENSLVENQRSSRIWVAEVASRRTYPLTSGTGFERFPSWSPDGRRLAFVATGDDGDCLMVADREGALARRLTGHDLVPADPLAGTAAFAWSRDGSSIACMLRDGEAVAGDLSTEGPRPTGDPLVTTELIEGRRGGPSIRLCDIDVETGKILEIALADRPFTRIAWAPDRSGIYAVERTGTTIQNPLTFRLLRYALDGVSAGVIEEFQGAGFAPALSPDGRRIAVSAAGGCGHAPSPTLYEHEIDTSFRHSLAKDDLTSFHDLGWFPEGDRVLAIADRGVERRLVTVDLESGAATPVTGGRPWIESAALSASGEVIAFVGSTPDDPGDVWVIEGDDGTPLRLTDVNPGLEQYEMGEARAIRWQAKDGTEIEGLLVLPAGYEEGDRTPLVLDYHGGPSAHVNLGWRGSRQIWASAGYAVLAPNFRGSTGYGEAFSEALRGDIGGQPYLDCLSGVDHLIDEGIADPDRIVIYGHSWGGYKVNWTITQTDRFKAAISSGSVANLFSVFGTRYASDVWEWRLHGTPWESPDLYQRWSPIFQANTVTTPTLFLNGAEDRTTPPTQGHEMFVALRKHDVPAEYVLYPGEGHATLEPAHRVDREQRILNWFARWITTDA